MSTLVKRRAFVAGTIAVALGAACKKSDDAGGDEMGPWMPPADLAARLAEVKAGKIAVLYVGPDALFGRGHVPGARNIGPAESAEGRAALAAAMAAVPAETEIVVYCGCCPVRSCPNVRPASAALRALGRKNARVLDLPTRFGTDWTDKGFAVERS